uniref:Large ribosomal subunit protein uL11m n=1 Tax=Corethron hystrix TaxID=216773 RepID=A0A7S1BAR1_9STRA|mmetsp:Transcript_19468/g.44336  ORF Transcript_19468/g.44336 Transcript_19468/m.44336 type:complete len:152 (+) Transcript_19468:143-598(+)|eukprot:CAMPEP_0113304072 /NCGR_PEP_ID=MMETSP0010_2-20120614/4224_1 /TAXON_ID=216773 ORGANISM="Corethron hystrix, Strain 308" /NCGR_SAMPLE_ID=MMETSP0010_2 /ASSEMBLY_ACC=CAM_ASM_000155 /LENGTH=151 /DNA_ID=CAMNT_0000158175 /DNA_START=142 /DNA_END=597 /DNA_ORIENTATION=- /assembly_acc=CAM_ASM_000155
MSYVRSVLLRVPAAAARPGPAIGQALGPLGVNMAEFCKQFNERTAGYVSSWTLPVRLDAFADRTFEFHVRSPPTSHMIKRAAGLEKGAGRPGAQSAVGSIRVEAVYEIAKIKVQDTHLADMPIRSVAKSIVGTALSMGVEVIDDKGNVVAE